MAGTACQDLLFMDPLIRAFPVHEERNISKGGRYSRLVSFAGFVSTVIMLLNSPCLADWPPTGTPVCRNPECLGFAPTVIGDGVGGMYVAWHDYRSAVPTAYVKRYSASGSVAPGWPERGVRASALAPEITSLAIASDGVGGVYVAWGDFPQRDIYLQRINGSGEIYSGWPIAGVPVCSAIGDQGFVSVVSDGSGGALIVWEDGRISGQPEDIYASHILGNGQLDPRWPSNGLGICTAPFPQTQPKAVSDNLGGLYVTWRDTRVTPWDLYALRILADGSIAPGWQENGTLVRNSDVYDFHHDLVADGQAGLFVLWGENPIFPQSNQDLYVTRIQSDGSPTPGWPERGVTVAAGSGHQQHASMGSDGVGGVVIVWDDTRNLGQPDVYAQRVLSDGSRASGWPENGLLVAGLPGVFEFHTAIAGDGNGGAFVAYEREAVVGTSYIQHLIGSGAVANGWIPGGLPIAPGNTDGQINPRLAADGLGGCFAVWTDANEEEIYGRHFADDVPTAVLMSLQSVETFPDRVTLTWHCESDRAGRIVAYRRSEENPDWRPIAHIDVGQSMVRVEDGDVRGGARYGYRLGLQEYDVESFGGEVWVNVPNGVATALEGFCPNPAVNRLRVAFTLSAPTTASLELLDVTGRSIMSRQVGQLGLGRHLVDLGETNGMTPGVYWVQLSVGDRKLVARALVMR